MSILQDQVVLVTGAGAGIGRATALGMAEAGANVSAADIDLAAAQRTADQAAGNSRRAIATEADCGDVASIEAMIMRTVAELGRLDVIVNNAGVTRYAQIMDLTEADWDRIHRVNAKGVFFCLQRAAREMIKQGGGRIINIASISGRGYPGASNAAYAASKGAVISLTWMAAQQPGRHNINVNAICPGVTRTELGARNAVERAAERGITVEELNAEAEARIPIGRANQPEDIAAMAVFLASPAARNITGQAYNVDGGLVPSSTTCPSCPEMAVTPAEAGVQGRPPRSAALGSRFRGNDEFKCSDALGDAQIAAAAERPAAVFLRLGHPRLLVLRRVCAAGAGGRDPLDLCRAVDPRVRLVAHRSVGRGVARRVAGGVVVPTDRPAARSPRLAGSPVPRRIGDRNRDDAAVADAIAAGLLRSVLHRPEDGQGRSSSVSMARSTTGSSPAARSPRRSRRWRRWRVWSRCR